MKADNISYHHLEELTDDMLKQHGGVEQCDRWSFKGFENTAVYEIYLKDGKKIIVYPDETWKFMDD